MLIRKDESTPIDQSDNNIGCLALHYLPSVFMSLPLKHLNTRVNYLGVQLHKSTCVFDSGRLFHANERGISILEKNLCLIVGREGRRERRWWASSYQVSPNKCCVMCAHTYLHTYTSPYPYIPHLLLSTHIFIPTCTSPHLHIFTPTHPHTHCL